MPKKRNFSIFNDREEDFIIVYRENSEQVFQDLQPGREKKTRFILRFSDSAPPDFARNCYLKVAHTCVLEFGPRALEMLGYE